MNDAIAAGEEIVLPHRGEQFGAGGRERMGRFAANGIFEVEGREGNAVFGNEAAQPRP